MIEVRRTLMSDFKDMEVQEVQKPVNLPYAKNAFFANHTALSFCQGKSILLIADITPRDDGYYLWMLVSKDFARYYRMIIPMGLRVLELHNDKPIYAHVDTNHSNGARFARWAGFKLLKCNDLEYEGVTFDLYRRAA